MAGKRPGKGSEKRGGGGTAKAQVARSHKSALVVIPPREQWGAIQAIRERHDRQIRRWMPHVNLLYPFAPPERWEKLFPRLIRGCAEAEPLRIRLAEIRYFKHTNGGFTLWLAPEPVGDLQRLQQRLLRAAPGYGDSGDFTPHLSIGQVARRASLAKLLDELQKGWKPLEFEVNEVSLIRRGDPPEDVFKLVRGFGLGRREAG